MNPGWFPLIPRPALIVVMTSFHQPEETEQLPNSDNWVSNLVITDMYRPCQCTLSFEASF